MQSTWKENVSYEALHSHTSHSHIPIIMAMPKYPTHCPTLSSFTVSAIIASPVTYTTALARPCKTRPKTWSAICRESHIMTVAQAMTTRPRRKGMRLEACRSAYQPHIARNIGVSYYDAPCTKLKKKSLRLATVVAAP